MTSLYYVNILDVWYFFESMMTSHYYVNILDVWDFFLINNDVTRIEIKLKNVYANIRVHENLILGGKFFAGILFTSIFQRRLNVAGGGQCDQMLEEKVTQILKLLPQKYP